MGLFQAEKSLVGEEGIGPALMVRSTTSALLLHPLAEETPQTHAYPAVESLERPLVAVLEVFKPAAKRRIESRDDHEETAAGSTRGLLPDRLLELVQALRSRTARERRRNNIPISGCQTAVRHESLGKLGRSRLFQGRDPSVSLRCRFSEGPSGPRGRAVV
jgi:hypothetical protein